jgi:hypothetical protein
VSVKRLRDAEASRERETHAAFVTLVTNAISDRHVLHTGPNSAGNCYAENSVKCSRIFLCDESNSVCDVQRRPRDGEACSFCACGQQNHQIRGRLHMLSYGQLPCLRGAYCRWIRTTLGEGIRVPEPFDSRHQKTGNS